MNASGQFCVYVHAASEIIVDVTGYMTASSTVGLETIVPARVVDTRSNLGLSGKVQQSQERRIQITGVAGVPAHASAVALNLTVVNQSQPGWIAAYPCGSSVPDVSTLNNIPGRARANAAIVPIGADGQICVYGVLDTDVLVDVTGYMVSGGMLYQRTNPVRLFDSRQSASQATPLSPGAVTESALGSVAGIPATTGALSVNITGANHFADGYITVFPCGDRPAPSNLNPNAGAPVANSAHAMLSAKRSLCMYHHTGGDTIVDLNGVWVRPVPTVGGR